jgi:hypothetical protein
MKKITGRHGGYAIVSAHSKTIWEDPHGGRVSPLISIACGAGVYASRSDPAVATDP